MLVDVEQGDAVGVDLHGRVVAAVDEGDGAVVVELGEDGGDEVLLADDRVHELVERRRDGGEVGALGAAWRKAPTTAAASWMASRPLPRTSPTIIRTPKGVVQHLVEVAADERVVRGDMYRAANATWPTECGIARRTARCAASATT